MCAANRNATFSGAYNSGLQVGDNPGSINYTLNVTHSAPVPGSRPPPSSTVPFRPDPDYVQRDVYDELWRRSCEPASRVALVGLGGVGKSQLAITYSHQARKERPESWVFWVHASNAARFEEGYKTIAERVQLDDWNKPKADVLALVRSWLSSENSGRWVIIVDNADTAAVLFDPISGNQEDGIASLDWVDRSLSDCIPQVSHGSVVITSRSRDVAYRLTGRMEDILDVPPMDIDTSTTLLRKKLGGNASEEDMVRLVATLEGMPLAITQAAAYIRRRAPRMTVPKYLQELSRGDDDRARLLQQDVGDPRRDGRASNSIITTWHVSFAHIQQERPSTARLLALMSMFDREGIPASLLYGYAENKAGDADFEDDVDMLRSYCLVGVGGQDDTFEMHQLVQFATKKWLEQHRELQRWQEQYIDTLWEAFPTGEYKNWVKCTRLFPHAKAAISCRPTTAEYLVRWATLLYRASWYAAENGRYGEAEIIARDSITAQEKVLGVDHPDTLSSVDNLATVLGDQGKYEQAEEMNQRTLIGREKVLGVDHPSTLTSMSNLALVLRYQGKYEQAEEMNQRALIGYEKVLGVDHPNTLTSVGNLASVLRCQGKYEQAEEMNRRALVGKEKALGVDHPDTLTSVDNLATVLGDQGKYEQAEEMNRRALIGREKVLGVDHPSTLTSVSNLALVLQGQGKYEQAEEMNRRVLIGREKVLGVDHPSTLTSVSNLALVLQGQGKYEQAEEMNRRALVEKEKALGVDHPSTLTSVSNLALVLQGQGKYEQAEEMNRRALVGKEKALGADHPHTLRSVYCLAHLLSTIHNHREALNLYGRAMIGFNKVLGPEHPTTAACRRHMALLVEKMR